MNSVYGLAIPRQLQRYRSCRNRNRAVKNASNSLHRYEIETITDDHSVNTNQRHRVKPKLKIIALIVYG